MRGCQLCAIIFTLPWILVYGQDVSSRYRDEQYARYREDAIRLKDVNYLTLNYNLLTTSRRGPGVPQLKCIGGTAGCSVSVIPKVVQCYKHEARVRETAWDCRAELDVAYKIGWFSVSCEGYDHPQDEFVVRGSCGVEYELDLTQKGKEMRHREFFGQTGINYEDTLTSTNIYQRRPLGDAAVSRSMSPVGIGLLVGFLVLIIVIMIVFEKFFGPKLRLPSRKKPKEIPMEVWRTDPNDPDVEVRETLVPPKYIEIPPDRFDRLRSQHSEVFTPKFDRSTSHHSEV